MVENRVMEANTPYYVVVNRDSVELATPFKTTIEPQVNTIGLNDYEFSGTLYFLDKGTAVQNKIYCIDNTDNLKWNVMTADNQQDVSAFRGFFRSVTGKTSTIKLTFETVADMDFEYAIYTDAENNRYLHATKYIGEGGDVEVSNNITVPVDGVELELPVTYIDENAFKDKADMIRSVDLTKCENLEDMYVDRNMRGNSFYGLKETTLVYFPKDKALPTVNTVVGGVCQKLVLKEGEEFYSIYDFKAQNVEYKRAMDANDNYTICLPYSAPTISGVKYYELKGISNGSLQFTEVTQTQPGVPYMVVTTLAVDNFDYDDSDHDGAATDIVSEVTDGSSNGEYTMYGTFSKISPAETVDKFILQDNKKWQKAKTENAAVFINPFRAYLLSTGNSGDIDSDIDDGTAIKNIHTTDMDGTEQWYDLNGRCIDGKPSKKGVYIRKGKKVVLH